MSEIRYDRIFDKYVVIAPQRLRRPELYPVDEKMLKDTTKCPFCKGHEDMTPPSIYTLKDKETWSVRVVPNLYRAFEIEAKDGSIEDGIYEKRDGFGAHEVIIDSDKHIVKFEDLSKEQMKRWLFVIKQRVEDLKKDIRLNYFAVFKNQGKNSGATLPHVHTQLTATSVLPKEQLSNLKRYAAFYREFGRSIFEDIVDFEIKEQKRVFLESENFIAFCPYASSFAFEVMILPKIDISCVIKLDDMLMGELSALLKDTLIGLKGVLGEFDYNLYIENTPMQRDYQTEEFFDDMDRFFRFFIRIIPRLYKIGGFELQSGQNINPVVPQNAAELIKKGNFSSAL